MLRRAVSWPLALAMIAAPGIALAVTAAPAPATYDGGGATRNILPPGSNGTVTAGDLVSLGIGNSPNLLTDSSDPKGALATATPTTPPNFADQLELYDALNTIAPYSLKAADLTKYYKDASIAPSSTGTTTESPKAGVTIVRDSFDVPHITGTTAENVAYGAGYAGIEDRMFLTDILRHTGEAQMASFLGPSAGDIAMDQAQLQLAPYTPDEAQKQIDSVVQRYGAEGKALLARLDAFIQGMNDAQSTMCPASGDGNDSAGDNGAAGRRTTTTP